VLEEVYRLMRGGAARRSIELLCETGTAAVLSPQLAHLYGASHPPADELDGDEASLDGDTDDLIDTLPPPIALEAHEVDAEADETTAPLDDAPLDEPTLDEAPLAADAPDDDDARDLPAPPPLDPEARRWADVWRGAAPLFPYGTFDDGFDDPPGHRGHRSAAAPLATRRPAPPPARPMPRPAPTVYFAGDGELGARRAYAYRALAELDVLTAAGVEASNALLTALLAAPFVHEDLGKPGLRPVEIAATIEGVLDPLISQLQAARRDAERAGHMLHLLRRLIPGRPRPSQGQRREGGDDAQLLCELLAAARGEPSGVPYWNPPATTTTAGDDVAALEVGDDGRKRRRRRRGGRRRRRGGGDDDDGDAGDDRGAAGDPSGGDDPQAGAVEPASA
jgi:ribonuclease E